jgi:hypothetical protein
MWYRYVPFCCTTHGFPDWIIKTTDSLSISVLTHSRNGFPEKEICLSSNVYLFVFFSVTLLSLCWCLLISLEVGKYGDYVCAYFDAGMQGISRRLLEKFGKRTFSKLEKEMISCYEEWVSRIMV